ncbi:beta-galactosidase [Microbacterium trichothecenolyticum]|uniref:glycoside hydrolase family 2 TIM barrel-domain containing protein n=1 Tax=Microbacterium trichothecenolyticum TaxID=69370 RepID=UPI0028622A92|nr:glycoside hydrolase family 2 TIM barrel-domain containing protein [Microbacterium trichothecenolyticum]MDR7187010.1 beta-galactosidase [Microbacterium trichothecenolyticum]
MSKYLFNDDWSVRRKVSGFVDLMGGAASKKVTLPHDAMMEFARSADVPGGASSAFFPGGEVEYTKRFDVPAEWRERRATIEFEGVYRDAMVYVNDEFAGQWKYGYSVFRVPLDAHLRYGQENVVRVEARANQDSRWYTGLGIYRDVHLVVTPLAHIVDDEIRITTPDVDDERAVVESAILVRNESAVTRRLSLEVEVRDATGAIVACDRGPVTIRPHATTTIRNRLYVDDPLRWGVDHPHLYDFHARLHDEDGTATHEVHTAFGIRTIRIDPRHGLRINDEPIKLRGACIHHDNGPLGAATIPRAEERRIELLKEAGFNAIRSSHCPASPAMLDACDRLGVLVFDETFDAWTEMNKPYDYTLDFPEWWERDVDAMVRKDFNHPSVILYCIGNEIHEYGSGFGGSLARDIAERIRLRDETRFITTAVSSFWAVAGEVIGDLKNRLADATARGVNDVMNEMTEFFDEVTVSDVVTVRTAEAHAAADIAGLNYAEARYAPDAVVFPNRVVLGTETNPRVTAQSWGATIAHDHVIGGFTWTGWDYLGEVGLGRTDYTDDPEIRGGGDPEFPWLTAWAGDLDITGFRRPQSYYREIVYGLRREPYIAVLRPQHYGRRRLEMQWAWSDAVASWTWDLPSGARAEIEVYSDADEVELVLNDRSLGRSPAGPSVDFRTRFDVAYEPGELVAIAYRGGRPSERAALVTASDRVLVASADRSRIRADSGDLAYISVEFRDEHDVLNSSEDAVVHVSVDGPGELVALGSARPATDERFDSASCTTFDGRALAIVRPTSEGQITVTVHSPGLADAHAVIAVGGV